MSRNIVRLFQVAGLKGRHNDLILARARCDRPKSLVIFFHGDIQDYPEAMSLEPQAKRYIHWNLDNVAKILADKFSDDCIMIVKASRHVNGIKACFDNFVESDFMWEPIFAVNTDALSHLKALTERAAKIKNWFNLNNIDRIKLIGFSQGMAPLNQIVYSLYALDQSTDASLHSFASLITHIYWLDGGKCWLTDEKVVRRLVARGIKCHVAVTPLQVRNPNRPENEMKYNIFKQLLEKLGINFDHKLHFEEYGPSFDAHFQLIQDFQPN